jgi:regulatory protein
LKAKDDGEKAWQKALHFLSFRPRSAREIRQHLLKREIPAELVEETLVRLEKSGLVNDQDFARLWVENRSEFHPRSRRMLTMELRRKGVNDEAIQPALENLDEGSLALEAARRHARRLEGKPWQEFLQKLAGFLQRRGFSYDVVSPVVSKVWKELQTADAGGSLNEKDEIWDKT